MPIASRHFQIEPLTDGVYAAIMREGGNAVSNAGIVDLGDRALLFDMLGWPQAARDLLTAAEYLTNHPITLAANSHWHADHVLGNQVLPPTATILSTRRTRDLIAARIPQHITRQRQQIPRMVRQLEDDLIGEANPDKRRTIGDEIDFYRMVSHDLPALNVRLPDITFEHKLVLHGPARTVELLCFGGGHTESDAILYLPDDQIVFVGDLLFHQRHPYLSDGDPDAWLAIYDQIEALPPGVEVVVPGHGPVATPEAFADLRRYVRALRQIVTEIVTTGGGADDIARLPVPAAFTAWPGRELFTENLRFMYEYMQAESQSTESEDDSPPEPPAELE